MKDHKLSDGSRVGGLVRAMTKRERPSSCFDEAVPAASRATASVAPAPSAVELYARVFAMVADRAR
jgi:hypothetical protein